MVFSKSVITFLGFVILAIPIAGLSTFLMSRETDIVPERRKMLRFFTKISPLLTLAVYVLYELGMPKYMNIRVDILLLWPVILISFWAIFIKID